MHAELDALTPGIDRWPARPVPGRRCDVAHGGAGLAVGRLQEKLKIAPSTLSHHTKALVVVGLVTQVRDATTLICHANYEVMRELVGFLVAECCTESAETKDAKTAA